MKKQSTQVIALVSLVLIWAVLWKLFIGVPHITTVAVAKPAAAKTTQSDTLLRARFRRVRSEMDALYHYRLKPVPFDGQWNIFRVPTGVDLSGESVAQSSLSVSKSSALDASSDATNAPDYAQKLLKSAVANMKIGGVVTHNGITELTVDGQLHKEGDVFGTKVTGAKGPGRSIIVGIKHLSTESVTLNLVDSEAGSAEVKVRLN